MPKAHAGRSAPNVNRRKRAHLKAVAEADVDLAQDSFARWQLGYNALPELSLEEVDLRAEFAGRPIAAPLIISCMTGGIGEPFVTINRRLAEAAETLRVPVGLGSMRVLLEHPRARESFAIRAIAPSVPIIANLGLVSLNHGVTGDDVMRLIDVVQPDLFAFHLNALQEAIQDGGDTDFRGLLGKLADLVRRIRLPVYVKECGGGIAPRLVRDLFDLGVRYVDISGRDGTSWSAIEAALSRDPEFGAIFRDFGLPTAWILDQLGRGGSVPPGVVASGGIRHGIQAAKALALGAEFVAMARPFVLAASESTEAVVALGQRFIRELRTAMFLVGARSLASLNRGQLISTG